MTAFIECYLLTDAGHEHSGRIAASTIDPAEEAGVIDRALLPVLAGGRGWVRNRHSGYTVTGNIGAKRALLHVYDGEAHVADIGICLHSRAASGLLQEMGSNQRLGQVPWCALKPQVASWIAPDWFDAWLQTLAIALLRREGW